MRKKEMPWSAVNTPRQEISEPLRNKVIDKDAPSLWGRCKVHSKPQVKPASQRQHCCVRFLLVRYRSERIEAYHILRQYLLNREDDPEFGRRQGAEWEKAQR
jgi:hypothetical protein